MFNFTKNSKLNMLRTIIIDDENHIRRSLAKMLDTFCPQVKLVASSNGVKSGIKDIQVLKPDLILLDIKMKDGTGFDLLNQLQPIDFKIIFITAYDQYAIKAFRCSAIDYLLKPVDTDELVEAVQKAENLVQKDFNVQMEAFHDNINNENKADKKIILKTLDNVYLIKIKDILYCESQSSYTMFYLFNGKNILVSTTLKEYDDLLKDDGFYRVHKSYLINTSYIERFEKSDGGNVILENNCRIPVASRKREELLAMFEKFTT